MAINPLGDGWAEAPDGVLEREGARLIVFDSQGRLLLLNGHDPSEPSRKFWFTPGGGINPGEHPRAAAVRELLEESGIEITERDLLGPVAARTALFDFRAVTCRQHEQYFLAGLDVVGETAKSRDTDLTEMEKDAVDGQKWWQLDELEAALEGGEVLYPRDLITHLHRWAAASRARKWVAGTVPLAPS